MTDMNAQALVLDYEIPSHINTFVKEFSLRREGLAKENNIRLLRELAAHQYDVDNRALLKYAVDKHLDAAS